MNVPQTYNFPDSYRNDGIRAFTITLVANETPIDLSEATVRMPLVNDLGRVSFEFSTADVADGVLTANSEGVIQFPEIKSWDIPSGVYKYDLEVTAADGFVTTYLRGTIKIINDLPA